MVTQFLISGIVLLSLLCLGRMLWQLRRQPKAAISSSMYGKLSLSGILAFIADTLGLGSFAVNIALAKLLNTFKDEELPAVNNGAQVLPGMIESLFFMQAIHVDLTMLTLLIMGTCLGGILGGKLVSRLSKQAIRLAMMSCFALVMLLLLAHQLHWLPSSGTVMVLHGGPLMVAFIAMIICGILTSVGIGLFVLVQGVLFVLNVSPLVAFPIMTAAGAMQQPLTTWVFLQEGKIPVQKTLVLSLAGCVGVGLALSVFTHLSISGLHSLLFLIVMYNFYAVTRAYLNDKQLRIQAIKLST
ncbi:MAG: hypothetical protein CMF38_03765 [Legionellaceae bacterium]|nr:hypothetical protein [Legionellaceae bacterium]HAF87268.1 hypothetical protein [Legionellales bacterium]HCA89396.1 hypothetical protein [Legionellales bacterium]